MSLPDPRTAVAEMLGLDPAAGYPTGDSLQADQFRAMAQLMGVDLLADPTQSGADVGVELPHEPISPGLESGADEAPVAREVGAATLSLVQAGSSVEVAIQEHTKASHPPATPSLHVVNPDVEADDPLDAQINEPPEDELVGQEPPDLDLTALAEEDDPHYRAARLPQAPPQATTRDPLWGEPARSLRRIGTHKTLPREFMLLAERLANGQDVPEGWAERPYYEPVVRMLTAVARGEKPQPYVDSTKPAARQAAQTRPPSNSDVPAVLHGLDVRPSIQTVHLPPTDQPEPADQTGDAEVTPAGDTTGADAPPPDTPKPLPGYKGGFDPEWQLNRACKDEDPDHLFVQGAAQNRAKATCGPCAVRTECLADALDNRIEFGVWGGMTERERRALLRRRPNVASWGRLLATALAEPEQILAADPE